ncbi:bacteriocin-like protein [Chryseobacterium sp. FH2]|uniref:bacteriocin-like protein n=1 Tax=Chryseobacterium sp. FH2 TaxID=1674291 RepID=UPI000AD3E903
MKKLKRLSRNELKKVSGGKMAPNSIEDDGCYVNLYSCPGQGKARLSANGQNWSCC